MIRVTVNKKHVVMTCGHALWARDCILDQLADPTINELRVENEAVAQLNFDRKLQKLTCSYFGPKESTVNELDIGTFNEVFKSGSHLDKQVYVGYLLMSLFNLDNRKMAMPK